MSIPPEQTGRKILSGPQVARKCGVTTRALWNWRNDPKLAFPAGLRINERDYNYEDEIAAWLLERAKDALRRRKAIVDAALNEEVA